MWIWILYACRPEPIERPTQEWDSAWIDSSVTEKEGPDPYVEGEKRLSLGIFYEGGFSHEIPIDDVFSSFYIWVVEGTSTPTYSNVTTTDCVEGRYADKLMAMDAGWFGGGLSWSTPTDLSQWKTMHISIKADDDAFSFFQIGRGGVYKNGGSCTGSGFRQNWVYLSNYGFETDGTWHHLSIPLFDLSICLDSTQITEPLSLLIAGLSSDDAGKSVYIDNIYLTEE